MHSGHIGILLGMTFTQQISSDLLREAVDRADDGIYITDRDGTILCARLRPEERAGNNADAVGPSVGRGPGVDDDGVQQIGTNLVS